MIPLADNQPRHPREGERVPGERRRPRVLDARGARPGGEGPRQPPRLPPRVAGEAPRCSGYDEKGRGGVRGGGRVRLSPPPQWRQGISRLQG